MLCAMIARFLAALLVTLAALAGAAEAQPASARAPVVVELYTSQGCWQCPRANRLLGVLSREDGLLALTFPVGYWDYLGWADTFAQPEFSNRQRDYARTLRMRGRFTPQLVIDGARQVSASDWDLSRAAIEQARAHARPEGAPAVSIQRLANNHVRVVVGAGAPGQEADIWLFGYDSGPVTVSISSGENADRLISHYNLVRWMARIEGWNGAPTWFERARCAPECAVIVQGRRGGPVLGAAFTRR